jgi:hypothetical protein
MKSAEPFTSHSTDRIASRRYEKTFYEEFIITTALSNTSLHMVIQAGGII